MAFNTLPMPTDMIYHQFQGVVLGNSYSCTAQGFFKSFGAACGVMYCTSLLVYYAFSIRKKKTDSMISKRVEPALHAISLGYALAYSLSLLVFEAYNPTPLDAWCTAITYPWWCPGERDKPCLIRAKRESYKVHFALAGSSIIILLVMVISLSMVVLQIYSERRIVNLFVKQFQIQNSPPTKKLQRDLARHKEMLKQCLVYFLVYLVVYFFPVFNMIHGSSRASNYGISVAHLLVRPLQGFFHMIIFLQHKVYNLRLTYPTISFWQAVCKACKAEEEPERIVSSLDIVNNDITDEIYEEEEEEGQVSVPNNRIDLDNAKDTASKLAVEDFNMLDLSVDFSSGETSSELHSKDLSGFHLSFSSSSNRN